MPLDAGQKIGRYTIVRLIAQGGMAEVYRAEQDLAGGITRPVAVKLIRPEYSESADFRQMFLDEARTACTLSHPNIAHIYEVGEGGDEQLYMAMELVPGETLATINRTLRDNGERFSDAALFAIGIFTCNALEAVHALKVEEGTVNLVHRDVSPHNLLLSSKGSLKLIDFGIAKAATNRNLTMPGVTKGKAGYFSPEQAMAKRLDGRSDLFSLGVTLYKLASGGTPFDEHKNHGERHAALVRGQWKELEAVYPGMPATFYAVVNKALMLKPEDRYQSAAEMRDALERAAFDGGVRLGQASLTGYVDDDGEITVAGGSRSSSAVGLPIASAVPPTMTRAAPPDLPEATATRALPAAPEVTPTGAVPLDRGGTPTRAEPVPPSKARRQTERVTAAPPPRRELPVKTLAAVAFFAAVVIGGTTTLLLMGQPQLPPPPVPRPAPLPPPPAVVVVPAVKHEPLEEPLVVEPKEPEQTEPPEVTVEPNHVTPPVVVKTPPRPRPIATVTHPPDRVEKPPKLTEETDNAIPPGQGKLRVGVTDDRSVAGVMVKGESWGAPPIEKRAASGVYNVVLQFTDGKKSAPWRGAVWPDKTTVLLYDVAAGHWVAK